LRSLVANLVRDGRWGDWETGGLGEMNPLPFTSYP
jgi:hypothetical protein